MDIKPCPFCGSDPIIQEDIRYPRASNNPTESFEVICVNNKCVIYRADTNYFKTKSSAIRAWNKRSYE